MKTTSLFVVLMGIGVLLNTCSKEDMLDDGIDMSFEEAIIREALTEEDAAFWDSQESIDLEVDEIVLPNGLTIEEFEQIEEFKKSTGADDENPVNLKNKWIQTMTEEARYLTTRSNFRYPAEDEGSPAQTGLAYSYGSRDHTIRQIPPVPGNGNGCSEKIYGLDCSGFVYRLFLKAGIDLMQRAGIWAELERRPDILHSAISKAFPSYSKYFKAEDKGKIDTTQFQTGDIIYWLEWDEEQNKFVAKHIGMVLKRKDGLLAIAQSNGKGYSGCVENYTSIKKGPRFCMMKYSIRPKSQQGFGDNYGIVRISALLPNAPAYTSCRVMAKVYGYYHEFTPSTSRDYESDNGAIQGSDKYTGSFNENIFTGELDQTVLKVRTTGNVIAFFNWSFDKVEYLYWFENSTAPDFTHDKSLIVKDVKKSPEPDIFVEEGETTCQHIFGLKNTQTSPAGLNYYLKRHTCTWQSKVYISFSQYN